MSQTLGDALPEAIALASELIGQQEQMADEMDAVMPDAGQGNRLIARILRVHRDVAVAAQQSGDVVAMLHAYNALKPAVELAKSDD